jgi:hypothetical protein
MSEENQNPSATDPPLQTTPPAQPSQLPPPSVVPTPASGATFDFAAAFSQLGQTLAALPEQLVNAAREAGLPVVTNPTVQDDQTATSEQQKSDEGAAFGRWWFRR